MTQDTNLNAALHELRTEAEAWRMERKEYSDAYADGLEKASLILYRHGFVEDVRPNDIIPARRYGPEDFDTFSDFLYFKAAHAELCES